MCESKETIKKCVKGLNGCYYKLYKCFCEGNMCTNCVMYKKDDLCTLCKIREMLNELEEKQQ